jgi:arsenical pump membrane protein
LGLLPLRAAGSAAARGSDVYLFLTGMMVLAEIARREGVFDWVASRAVSAAHGSRTRLFALVFGAGTVVTAILSNDATAVVLTPAVAAAVRKTGVPPLPYLYVCAFVANAGSFVLPISNPANLVVFQSAIPPLGGWLAAFALPSLLSLGATYAALAWLSRKDLKGPVPGDDGDPRLAAGGRFALGGIAAVALASTVASARGLPLGAVTCGGAALLLGALASRAPRKLIATLRGVSWSVLLLVAGLFVLVAAVDETGLLQVARAAAASAGRANRWPGALAAAATAALVSNITNNLPSGLIAGTALGALHGSAITRNATALGIDLGPNLSVTGSLATLLWLRELRRESIDIDAGMFLRAGAVAMPPALLLAVAGLCLTAR